MNLRDKSWAAPGSLAQVLIRQLDAGLVAIPMVQARARRDRRAETRRGPRCRW